MKTLIIMMVLSIVYLVAMDVVNKKIESLDFNNTTSVKETTKEASYYEVRISGAIANPGNYTVYKGATLSYLVTLAGGFNEDADSSGYNLNAPLFDKSAYYIPKINNGIEKISINNATIASLDTLPGIGSVLAKRIVSYRSQNGNFIVLEDITKVNGIGESLFEQIKDLICL